MEPFDVVALFESLDVRVRADGGITVTAPPPAPPHSRREVACYVSAGSGSMAAILFWAVVLGAVLGAFAGLAN